jgi:hypothetical protein
VIEDTLLLGAVMVTAIWLFRPALRRSKTWIATVTPLASIIGSGFLVVVPLLAYAVNGWAVVAMTAIAILAYAIGGVIRFNIRHFRLDGLGDVARGVVCNFRAVKQACRALSAPCWTGLGSSSSLV